MAIKEYQDTATYQEIISQPAAWAEALEVVRRQSAALKQLWAKRTFSRVLFTGCGSTYYLALAAASLFQQQTGMPSQAVPGSELLLYPDTVYAPGNPVLLVAISRSGTTTETVKAVQQYQASGSGPVIVISNYGDSDLALLGDITIAISRGQEKSVAQTRSFASMYVAAAALAVLLAGRDDLLQHMEALPAAGEKLIAAAQDAAQTLGGDLVLDRFYFLGSGPRYGLACEVNLKMKEMTLSHSEPFHFMEFRHGPMSMVTGSTLVIGMVSDANRVHEQHVLDDMRALGGRIFAIGSQDVDLPFGGQIPEAVRNVLYLPPLQLMAFYRSVAKGLDPDNPTNLSQVIHLDLP